MAKLTAVEKMAMLANDDVDLTTAEGRELWARLFAQRQGCSMEEARKACESLVQERLAAPSKSSLSTDGPFIK